MVCEEGGGGSTLGKAGCTRGKASGRRRKAGGRKGKERRTGNETRASAGVGWASGVGLSESRTSIGKRDLEREEFFRNVVWTF